MYTMVVVVEVVGEAGRGGSGQCEQWREGVSDGRSVLRIVAK